MNNNKKAGGKRRRDRLSSLPEPIIHHILSFLDTKSAVQTSVLSRSWRSAWKHVPALDLDQYSFQHYSSFHRYVGKVLSLRYPLHLETVRFVDDELRSDGRDDSLVIRVIQYALSHDAQHLVIYQGNDIISRDIYRFSDVFGSVSSRNNLKSLRLSGFELDRGFGSPCSWMLTTLHLVTCLVAWDQEVLEPFSNCPCLKYLVISDWLWLSDGIPCYDVDEKRIKIHGLELLSLKLESVQFRYVDIFAPKLKFFGFWVDDVQFRSYSNLSLPSLDHADIGFTGDLRFVEKEKEYMKTQLINLLQGLHNAKSLTLNRDSTFQVLSRICGLLDDEPSPFLRLESLIIDDKIENLPYKLVNYFFKGSSCASPNIQYIKA
ncbi:unnamed protein product [Linum trigynum]|uniref:F-box domain-containing protein n=1 Tax=Linum trigynum TaxID=586398 RepID=A0AAV2DKG4_9ROSI